MKFGFLLSGRWIGWLALTVAFAAACAALGSWQMDRRDKAVATVERVASNYGQAPISFDEAASVFEDFKQPREWTPVTMTGVYATEDTRIVRNRPLNGRPGYEVLVPLKLEDGKTVIINRGWLPIGNNNAGHPDSVPDPPKGSVDVVARIKPAEPDVRAGAPEGQLASINLSEYQQQLEYPILTGSYGLLESESPTAATAPRPLPKPDIDTGPHLSYSLQWFAFGLLGFVGLGYAARQQALSDAAATEHGEDDDGMHQAWKRPASKPRRKSARPTSEEEEDAILDAQGYQ